MKYTRIAITGLVIVIFAGGVGGLAWWLVTARAEKPQPPKKVPPAEVAKPITEDTIGAVKLTPQGEQSLGPVTTPVVRESIPRYRLYSGEVVVPEGHTIVVYAPLGGTLVEPSTGMLQPGRTVDRTKPVFILHPLLTPEARLTMATARVDAEGQVKNARISLDAAKVVLERAQRLLREEAGSKKAVDEAQALYDLAQKAFEAAEARRDVVLKAVGEFEKGTAAPIPVYSPQSGMLKTLAALPGQNVPAGARLFEIVDLDRVWVRVPIYAGEVGDIARDEEAGISGLGASAGPAVCRATPVAAPPTASGLTSTVDLYYELDNHGRLLTPGERVGVSLRLRGEAEQLTVPWSAIVHDIHGSTWVYERMDTRTYIRRRVNVRYVAGDRAALADGPAVGKTIVAEGAQELFAAETGFIK